VATIVINGRTYSGNSISINGGQITTDGLPHDRASGVVEIRITEGVVQHLTTDASVNCLNVSGDVHAGGSINCDSVQGSVTAGGSVNCDDVGGSIVAGGSVRHG
jgi:hypothetical protein